MGPSTLGEETSRKRRVRHALPPARWPTREEAARARWFAPLRLGASVVAEQRTWVPAMVPWRATEDGFVTPEVLDWYGRFAEGQPGVLVVEATGIRDVPSGPLLRIGDDRFLAGLARLVETASGLPVVLAGGSRISDEELLSRQEQAMRAGAVGCSVGRNIFMHEHPEAITRALRRVIVDRWPAVQALEEMAARV